jgi:hypothetical protein
MNGHLEDASRREGGFTDRLVRSFFGGARFQWSRFQWLLFMHDGAPLYSLHSIIEISGEGKTGAGPRETKPLTSRRLQQIREDSREKADNKAG